MVPQDPLKTLVASMAAALGTGIGGTLASGTWRTALFGLGVLALLCFMATLVSAGSWHRGELQEVGFDHARDDDTTQRGSVRHERDIRNMIADAAERSSDPAAQAARVSALIERERRYISAGRSSPVEIVVLDDHDPDAHVVVAQAGRLDQAIVGDPDSCFEWLESLGDKAYPVGMRVASRRLRMIGISDTGLAQHDRSEIQQAATHMQALLQNHAAVNASGMSAKVAP